MNEKHIPDFLIGLVVEAQRRQQFDDGIDDAALAWLMQARAQQSRACWDFNALTGTLYAADAGRPAPLVFQRVPFFAAHVADLLRTPRWPLLLGVGNRRAFNTERARLVDRLKDRKQFGLAEAIDDIRLEQDGSYVRGTYDPEGLDLLIAD
ncbi:MAG TPA: hypothetical protein PKH27_04800 [Candidatus Desulfobacillus denitrificans]|nr:hypothetical protein [Candidatus Desulfobacillus denitrificans]HNT62367.1 hypothetical protein [Candidatus Desulfobacillus denitrificans]